MEKEQRESGQIKTVSMGTGPSPALALTASTTAPPGPLAHPSLPKRPSYDFAAKADSIGLGAKPTIESMQYAPTAAQALGGSNRDVVANRAAIRMANLSARDMLKAEQAGAVPVKPDLSLPPKPTITADDATMFSAPPAVDDDFPGFGAHNDTVVQSNEAKPSDDDMGGNDADADADGESDPDSHSAVAVNEENINNFLSGVKRKIDEVDNALDKTLGSDEDDAPEDAVVESKALKVNPDGTVEQEDTIKYVQIEMHA